MQLPANVPILKPTFHWQCVSCGAMKTTHEPRPHTPFHPCPKVAGFATPYTRITGGALPKLKHRIVIREDYVGKEQVRLDENGRPIMAIHTERPDGSYDAHVYAPTALVSAKEIA